MDSAVSEGVRGKRWETQREGLFSPSYLPVSSQADALAITRVPFPNSSKRPTASEADDDVAS